MGLDWTYRAHRFIFSFSFTFLFVPRGRLSWLSVSFLLHVKYTVSYRIVWTETGSDEDLIWLEIKCRQWYIHTFIDNKGPTGLWHVAIVIYTGNSFKNSNHKKQYYYLYINRGRYVPRSVCRGEAAAKRRSRGLASPRRSRVMSRQSRARRSRV